MHIYIDQIRMAEERTGDGHRPHTLISAGERQNWKLRRQGRLHHGWPLGQVPLPLTWGGGGRTTAAPPHTLLRDYIV